MPLTASRAYDKIVRGGDSRRTTRFHDENDQFIGWWELRHLPHVCWTTSLRLLAGRLPELPWWPYDAIDRIDSIVTTDSTVVEFGTGTSTVWLARRARKVYGIEGSPAWFKAIRERSLSLDEGRLRLILRDSTRFPEGGKANAAFNEEFSSLDGVDEPLIDLVIVDGAARWRCVEKALPRIRAGGFLYLDNADADKDWCHYTTPGMFKEAQRILLDCETRGLGVIEKFRGLCPATPVASEGWLFTKL